MIHTPGGGEGESSPKADESTDMLRECDSDKGGGQKSERRCPSVTR